MSSKAKELVEAIERKQVVIQYAVSDNVFQPVGEIRTTPTLPAGMYDVKESMQGPVYEVHGLNTDELLRFEDSRYNEVLNEIADFWGKKEDYDKMGFTHKRGILLFGAPGTGKSCLTKLVMEDTVTKGDVVFITRNPHALSSGLAAFREVEPDRKVLVVMEDIDEVIRYDERKILEMFDGDNQVGNVLFLCTTNYLNQLPERMLRPSRLDRKIEVHNPPEAGRLAYLKTKLHTIEDSKTIEVLAKKTSGFSFGALREFLVGVYCLKQPVDKVVYRINNHIEESLTTMTEQELDEQLSEVVPSKNRQLINQANVLLS
jgi:SpoVK/Ycf46/Vps4 family AAA+-type ATPase